MRRNPDAFWIKGLFGVIAAIFIFWGIGVVGSGGRRRGVGGGASKDGGLVTVAMVNGESIEETDYRRAYANMERFYREIYKDQFKPELLEAMDLKGKALDQLIHTSLLRQEAERLGLEVTDSEIRDSIAAMPSFQQDGRFDKDLYVRVLHANRLTPAQFEDSQRQDILVRKLQGMITDGVSVSEAEAKERYQFDNDKIDLKIAHFEGAAYTAEVKLADGDAQAYYDKHKDTFELPEQVKIEYVLYPADKFADKVVLTDADLQKYFDDHAADFAKPEQVHARHILLKVDPAASDDVKATVRKKAEDVLAKVKAGGDFAKLAGDVSEDPGSAKKGGDLGFFKRGQMVPTFEAVAFSTEPGQVSDIVESPFGFHIIKVEEKQEASTPTLADVRDQVAAKARVDEARNAARTQAGNDMQKASQGEALAGLAQANGLSVVTPAPFAQGGSIENLGRSPLANAAFSVDAKQVGPLIDTPTGFIVFRTLDKIAAHVPALEEIRAKVEEAAKKEKAGEIAKQKAEAFLAEAKKSGIEAAAKAAGREIEETAGFPRSGAYVPKVGNSEDLKKAAFQLTKESPLAPAVYDVNGDSYIIALNEKIPADESQFATQKDTLIKQAEDRRKGQVAEEFINGLIAKANIERNAAFLASLSGNGGRSSRSRSN